MSGQASLFHKLITGLLAVICVGVVAIVVMVSIAVSTSTPSCDQNDKQLCFFEQYFQGRVIASLDASGTAVIADIYGRAWDSACLVLPYEASHCTPTFECADRLAAAMDKQHWRNNDQLWGLMLFSQCRFVLAARFELHRLQIDSYHPFAVDSTQPTQIQLVRRDKDVSGEEPSYEVRVVLGADA